MLKEIIYFEGKQTSDKNRDPDKGMKYTGDEKYK